MQKIDLAVWPRAELFRFFSAVSQPFYSVTFRVDVTNLHAYARAHGVSFYYALGYLVTDAVNAVENFRYTIRSGEVWLLDKRVPSFTDLKPGSQQFHIVTLPKEIWTASAAPPVPKAKPSRPFWTRAESWTI